RRQSLDHVLKNRFAEKHRVLLRDRRVEARTATRGGNHDMRAHEVASARGWEGVRASVCTIAEWTTVAAIPPALAGPDYTVTNLQSHGLLWISTAGHDRFAGRPAPASS